MRVDDCLDDLAARGDGVVSRRLAQKAGLSASSFHRWVSRRPTTWLAPGIVALGPTTSTLQRNRRLLRAALEANGPSAALADRSAAWAWGITHRPEPLTVVVRSNDHRTPLVGVRVRRSNRKIGLEAAVVSGWSVTSPRRTLLDLARLLDDQALLALACDAMGRGLFRPADALAMVARWPGMHGAARLERVTRRMLGTRPDSMSELLVREALATAGIATEPGPRVVATPLGDFQVDVPVVGAPVGVECDSVTFHGTSTDLERDHRKTNGLAAIGYRLVRVSYRQAVADLDEVVALVRSLVAANGASCA